MSVTPEEIAAYADGELTGESAEEVRAAIAADAGLTRQVERHRALKEKLAGHYAPILCDPVPLRLSQTLAARVTTEVVNIGEARERRGARTGMPRWSWIIVPSIAASLALVIGLPRMAGQSPTYADETLAGILETRLVADQSPTARVQVLLSFQADGGRFCRAFSSPSASGIACRDEEGWAIEGTGAGSEASTADYRMAGAPQGAVLAKVQQLAIGPALDADGERTARADGWR